MAGLLACFGEFGGLSDGGGRSCAVGCTLLGLEFGRMSCCMIILGWARNLDFHLMFALKMPTNSGPFK